MNDLYWMYVSLWAEHGGAPGLGLYAADARTGKTAFKAQLLDGPSFGCSLTDPERKVLYLCNEEERVRGANYDTGRIYGYRISLTDGTLSELFRRDTYCPNPSYLALDPGGNYMIVAHHAPGGGLATLNRVADGSYAAQITPRESLLELYAVRDDGTLGDLLDLRTHAIDPDSKPYGSYLHCAVFAPNGKFFAVCDKGDGCVYLYELDREKEEMHLLSRTATDVPGAHPRYCVFHPTQPYFVVNHEQMTGGRMALSSFRYEESGAVEKVSTIDVLPPDCAIPPCSHFEQQGLCISRDGSYVYSCLNGPNAIAVLSLDGETGELKLVQRAPVKGEWPRGLALLPGGKFLAVSCLVSGDISVYAVGEDGRLTFVDSPKPLRGGAYLSFCERSEG